MNKSFKAKSNRKLRNFLIHPRYQVKVMSLTAVTGIVMIVANVTIFYIFIREHYSTLSNAISISEVLRLQLQSELQEIVLTIILFSIVWLALLCLLTLMITHRSAGPLYRFKCVFDAIRAGKHDTRIVLRPKDDFHEVAESFNSMMETLLVNGKEGDPQ